MSAPDLWDDPDRARRVTRRLSSFEQTISAVGALESELDDAEVLLDLSIDESDLASLGDVVAELEHTGATITELEREALFFGEYDDRPAIIAIHAGAGGVDAPDLADKLFRKYTPIR